MSSDISRELLAWSGATSGLGVRIEEATETLDGLLGQLATGAEAVPFDESRALALKTKAVYAMLDCAETIRVAAEARLRVLKKRILERVQREEPGT